MSRRTSAAIAGAFAVGMFVAAAPTVLGHGPGADAGRFDHHGAGQPGHMAVGCDGSEGTEHWSEMSQHMRGSGTDHMFGTDGGWMTDMMFGFGGGR